MVPVWKWWVCSVGHCPIAYSTEQDCAVLTPAEPSLTYREPKWRSKFSTVTRTVMSLFLDHYVLQRLCHRAQRAAAGSGWHKSINKSLRFALLTFAKIWTMWFWLEENIEWQALWGCQLTSKLLVTGTPTPLTLLRLSDRKLQSDNQLPSSVAWFHFEYIYLLKCRELMKAPWNCH